MKLDVPTLLVVLVAILQMAAIALMTSWTGRRFERHTLLWAGGLQLGAICCAMLLLRGVTSDFVSIALANSGVLLAMGLGWNGARAFNGRPARWWPVLIAPTVWLVAWQVPAIAHSLSYRIALLSVLSCVLSCALAWEIWARGKDDLVWRGPFAAVPAVHAVFLVFRALLALSLDLPENFLAGRSALSLGIGLLEPILMMFAATIIGLRLSDERLKNLLKRAASVDGLTGLLNHGAFMDLARARVERARADAEDITLLLFDLDRFKQLNDRFGHAAGDAALRRFAEVVRRQVDEAQLVGRIGGEEFAALLVGAGAVQGRAVAERIRVELAAEQIEHAGGTVAVTVSIGVMSVRGPEIEFERLMVAADEALYAAKRGGRDLVYQVAS
ncbi:GGDEF domain-containing protein [Kaistia adipata]|uniref:GGDEF domain-containing protein n=1 Tax=Kaistia adipata TaxID=166954 RepID=UPI0003F50B6F|nr:GGDEF domain-containing protein [Kaistia adipata]